MSHQPVKENLVPFRYEISWVSAERTLTDAARLFDAICEVIASEGGMVQGGATEMMSREDVVPDSPLAEKLS